MRKHLDEEAHRHINTDSDSEILLNIFAEELEKTGKKRLNEDDIFKCLSGVYSKCQGGFSCVALLAGFGIIGFRDQYGIRPIQIGSRSSATLPGKRDFLISSESVVFDCLDSKSGNAYNSFVDLLPGQAVIIPKSTMQPVFRQVSPQISYSPDIFEYVYFSRPDSVLDGINVYRSRLMMGQLLADEVRRRIPNYMEEIDVVVPVPDTARECALELAQKLGLLYREAFVKNRYIGRTFIMPGQNERRKNVRRKLNAMAIEFRDRNVLIVDDSIVRGTTSKEIVQMAREKGALKVFLASCAPAIRFPHIYGIDLADTKELVASGRTDDEIATELGADLVIYQRLSDLEKACSSLNPSIKSFETGVFTGKYVTGVHDDYIKHLEAVRGVNARIKEFERKRVANGAFENHEDHEDQEDLKAEDDISLYNGASH